MVEAFKNSAHVYLSEILYRIVSRFCRFFPSLLAYTSRPLPSRSCFPLSGNGGNNKIPIEIVVDVLFIRAPVKFQTACVVPGSLCFAHQTFAAPLAFTDVN